MFGVLAVWESVRSCFLLGLAWLAGLIGGVIVVFSVSAHDSLGNDEPVNIISTASNISDRRFNKIKDFELATSLIKSKKGVQCIITNSRHCSFGYDQRVELFGSKGMVISENKRDKEISTYLKGSTSNKTPLMNFLLKDIKKLINYN